MNDRDESRTRDEVVLMLTVGSLFDGLGGFPLSAQMVGMRPVWASEIESFPIRVTTERIPTMKHVGDITKLNGAELYPVDLITFGSPCQDLSVAGKRSGLEGKRSSLFYQATRIIEEMRAATDGAHPRFAIWENVPGAFSSQRGRDFRAVLEELTGCEIPVPQSGRWKTSKDTGKREWVIKWANAGMVRGNGREVAWRLLDAQYFGVPQRRKRIFLVVDFRGTSAAEILFESESLPGDIDESQEAGQGTAKDSSAGVDTTIAAVDSAIAVRMREGCAGGGKGPLISEDKSLTIACNNDQILFANSGMSGFKQSGVVATQHRCVAKQADVDLLLEPKCYAFCAGNSSGAGSIGFDEEISPTVRGAAGGNQVPAVLAISENQRAEIKLTENMRSISTGGGKPGQGFPAIVLNIENDIAPTLRRETHGHLPTIAVKIDNTTSNGWGVLEDDTCHTIGGSTDAVMAVDVRNLNENEELSGTIQAKESGGYSLNYQNPVRIGYMARRLTPLEVNRCFGFPDYWAHIEGASDTAIYKAFGNSLAIVCAVWILGRLKAIADYEEVNTHGKV